MIRLYRWHVDKHYQMTEIDDIAALSDISIPFDDKQPITLQENNVIHQSHIKIKDGVQFLIGYHAVQRNIYLIINNTSERKINDEMTFAELKGYYNEDIPIIVTPSKASKMQYFGGIIAQALSMVAHLVIDQVSTDSLSFYVKIGAMWESEFELPINELFELIEVEDNEKIPQTNVTNIKEDEVEATLDVELKEPEEISKEEKDKLSEITKDLDDK